MVRPGGVGSSTPARRTGAVVLGTAIVVACVVVAALVLGRSSSPAPHPSAAGVSGPSAPTRPPTTRRSAPVRVAPTAVPALPARPASTGPAAVGLRVLRLVDYSRSIADGNGQAGPRTITTLVRYPAAGPSGAVYVLDAPALTTSGPLPLIVFGHGFSVTPAPYAHLLVAWARAGFVVAAPIFPLENANAPGGPNERDLVNQPGDMSFVISRLLRLSRDSSGGFSGLLSPSQIAVAGQSDGGDTALATAYDPSVRDGRVTAAVILSGAEDPFRPAFAFPAAGPALLATQGTADTINPPSMTDTFFASAGRPKFLLELPGAGHQAPYTEPGPDRRVVELATVAFLSLYLKGHNAAFQHELADGTAGAGSVLRGEP